jgi:hypothetical protein
MSIGIFAVGLLFLVTGVTYLAYLNNLSGYAISGAVLVMLGVAVAGALQTARRPEV